MVVPLRGFAALHRRCVVVQHDRSMPCHATRQTTRAVRVVKPRRMHTFVAVKPHAVTPPQYMFCKMIYRCVFG